MRINKYIAQATGHSRRSADKLIEQKQVRVNGELPQPGHDVTDTDTVTLDGQPLSLHDSHTTIALNKPVGYVCSRDGQGSQTIYDLLPVKYTRLKPVGRLDKDSSGLILLTDDGDLAHKLTHPSFEKTKVYDVVLSRALTEADQQAIKTGIALEDGISRLTLNGAERTWTVYMHEGRNRQIRRTFEAAGYQVTGLHRVEFGEYILEDLKPGEYQEVVPKKA